MSTNMPPSSVNSHFYHIPKTGGRSIIAAFGELNYPSMNLSAEDMYGFVLDTIKLCGPFSAFKPKKHEGSSLLNIHGFDIRTYGSMFLTFGHDSYHLVEENTKIFATPSREQMESCRSFTVVREPISRMFSYYKEYLEELSRGFVVPQDLLWANRLSIKTSIHELCPKSDSELSERKEWTFEDFIKALPNERKLEQVYYFSKTFDIKDFITELKHQFITNYYKDNQYYYSKESFLETILCNGYEFTEEGKIA